MIPNKDNKEPNKNINKEVIKKEVVAKPNITDANIANM